MWTRLNTWRVGSKFFASGSTSRKMIVVYMLTTFIFSSEISVEFSIIIDWTPLIGSVNFSRIQGISPFQEMWAGVVRWKCEGVGDLWGVLFKIATSYLLSMNLRVTRVGSLVQAMLGPEFDYIFTMQTGVILVLCHRVQVLETPTAKQTGQICPVQQSTNQRCTQF